MLNSKKDQIITLKHVFFCGIRFGANYNETLLTFFTTKPNTYFSENAPNIKNIETITENLGYTNPL
jgi:hypothetical protein